MNKFKEFFKKQFIFQKRWLIHFSVLLILVLLIFAAPNFSLKLSPIGIDKEISFKSQVLNSKFFGIDNNMSLKKSGLFSDRYILIFDLDKKLSLSEYKEQTYTISKRLRFSGNKDIGIASDYEKRLLRIDTNASVSNEYIIDTVQSTGDIKILLFDPALSKSATDTFLRDSYKDIGITRSNFTRVARIALDDRESDDPAARFEIRVTLDEDSHRKIVESQGVDTGLGVFDGDRLIGFLSNFSRNRYILDTSIQPGKSGEVFYSVMSRLKTTPIKDSPVYKSSESVPANWGGEILGVFFLQSVLIGLIVVCLLVLLHRYRGLITALSSSLSILLATFLLQYLGVSLSQFTILGAVLGASVVIATFMYLNISKKTFDSWKSAVFLFVFLLVLAYFSNLVVPTIYATMFVPIVLTAMTAALVLLAFNKPLIDSYKE